MLKQATETLRYLTKNIKQIKNTRTKKLKNQQKNCDKTKQAKKEQKLATCRGTRTCNEVSIAISNVDNISIHQSHCINSKLFLFIHNNDNTLYIVINN